MTDNLPDIMRDDSGVRLDTVKAAMEFALIVKQSGLAPKQFQSEQQIFAALQLGAEIGLPPMQALQSICVINGKPSLYGDALPALAWASGVLDEFEEWIGSESDPKGEPKNKDDITAYCMTKRKGQDKPRVTKFSWAMAKQAGLTTKVGPWRDYPQRMLQMRARSWNFRDNLADVLRGISVSEETRDYRQANVTEQTPISLEDLSEKPEQQEPDVVDEQPTEPIDEEEELRRDIAEQENWDEQANDTKKPEQEKIAF